MGCILDTWLRSASVPLDIYRRAEERSRAEYSGIAEGGEDGVYIRYMAKVGFSSIRHL